MDKKKHELIQLKPKQLDIVISETFIFRLLKSINQYFYTFEWFPEQTSRGSRTIK